MPETYDTAIGKLLLETNWDTVRWFFEQRAGRELLPGRMRRIPAAVGAHGSP